MKTERIHFFFLLLNVQVLMALVFIEHIFLTSEHNGVFIEGVFLKQSGLIIVSFKWIYNHFVKV